jgi:hypothetical protein
VAQPTKIDPDPSFQWKHKLLPELETCSYSFDFDIGKIALGNDMMNPRLHHLEEKDCSQNKKKSQTRSKTQKSNSSKNTMWYHILPMQPKKAKREKSKPKKQQRANGSKPRRREETPCQMTQCRRYAMPLCYANSNDCRYSFHVYRPSL